MLNADEKKKINQQNSDMVLLFSSSSCVWCRFRMVNAASSTASHAYRQTLGDPKVFRLLQLLPFFLKSFHKTVVKVGAVVVVIRVSGDGGGFR